MLLSQAAKNESEARQGWTYLGKMAIAVFAILTCLATLKFFTEDKFAPKNSGLGGALAQPRLDLLLVGSSHSRKSYDMRLLEKQTGVANSFLIAYDGAELSTISQMLDYLVARPEHCPRYLVVEAYSSFLARRPDLQDPRYFADAPPSLKLTILHSYLAEWGYRSALLDIFDLVVNRGNEEIITYPVYAPIMESRSYKGGRTDFYFPGISVSEFTVLKAKVNGNVPNPSQLSAFYHILDLARTHHIAVIFIDTPLPLPVSVNPDIQALKNDFKQILGARHISYIDGDQGYPIDEPELFSDSNHLSSKGREEFSRRISIVLKAWMASEAAAGY
jgi:hypothetical protein